MTDFHKLSETVKSHPLLFIGVGAVVAVYFLWPHGTAASTNTGASTAAVEAAAIAQAAQANTALTVAADQVQSVGLQTAAAQAINGQNTAAQVQMAQIAGNVATAGQQAALSATKVQSAAQLAAVQSNLTAQTAQEGAALQTGLLSSILNNPTYAPQFGFNGAFVTSLQNTVNNLSNISGSPQATTAPSFSGEPVIDAAYGPTPGMAATPNAVVQMPYSSEFAAILGLPGFPAPSLAPAG